jgi:hypothetical protein
LYATRRSTIRRLANRGRYDHAEQTLGIDLDDDLVTANDVGDADSGPNARQNYPLLTVASQSGTRVAFSGTPNSAPDTTLEDSPSASVSPPTCRLCAASSPMTRHVAVLPIRGWIGPTSDRHCRRSLVECFRLTAGCAIGTSAMLTHRTLAVLVSAALVHVTPFVRHR